MRKDNLWKKVRINDKLYKVNIKKITSFSLIICLGFYLLTRTIWKSEFKKEILAKEDIKKKQAKTLDIYNKERYDKEKIKIEEKDKENKDVLIEEAFEGELPENIKYFEDISLGASEDVTMDYFDDAIFLGNSRTETFVLYAGLDNATSYAYKGFSVNHVFDQPIVDLESTSTRMTVIEALSRTNFSKVYLMFGYNETGWKYPEVFIERYGELIDRIKEINPHALIYVQSILPVSEEASQANGMENNERIYEYNRLIADMVEEKDVYFLNVGKSVCDKNGRLPQDASTDGIHLNKDYAEKWLEYLKKHTYKGGISL